LATFAGDVTVNGGNVTLTDATSARLTLNDTGGTSWAISSAADDLTFGISGVANYLTLNNTSATFAGDVTAGVNFNLPTTGRIEWDSGLWIRGTTATDTIDFITNGTTTLTLDSSQNATFAGKIILSGTDKHLIADDTASTVYLSGGNASNVGGNISLYGTTTGSNQGDILFRSGSTQVGLWDESQTAWHLNGRLDLSDATNAGQIKFPATQNASSDANTLDDYEEGTFTATVTPSTSGTVTLDTSLDTLAYTKIGRQVTVTGRLVVSSVSSPVGYFQVSLPFAIANLADQAGRVSGTVSLDGVVAANISDFIVFTTEGDSFFKVYLGDNTSPQSDSAQELQAATDIIVTVTYFTT